MRLLVLLLVSASWLTSLPLSAQIGLYPHTTPSNTWQEPGPGAPDAQPLAALLFPDLLIDSLNYNNTSSARLLTRQYKYNRQEQLVEEWEHWLDDIHSIYTYDAQGRRQGDHRYRYVPSGIFEDSAAYSYDGMDRLASYEFLSLKNGEWQAKHRSTFSYEPDGAVVKLMETQGNGAWQQVNRNSTLKRPERASADYDWEEVWENGQWLMIYQKDRSFDDNNYLVLEQARQRAQFTAQSPLEFTYMREYHYDADYRLDYVWGSRWDLLLKKWMPHQKTVYEYDANQVLNKEITYKSDGVTPLEQYVYLSYNEPPYETVTKERLRQDWNAVSQEYKDAYLNYAEYFDLPDGRVLLHQTAKEYIPTNPDPWSLSIESRTYYLKSQLNSAESPAKAADCLLPNPYRLHTPVQCPELDANTRYLLQLVNMAGQIVYTRYFCGDTGWDIDRPLPAGMYAAAISTRGKLVSTHKLIIAE